MIFSGTLSSIGDFFCIEKPSHIRSVKLHILNAVYFIVVSGIMQNLLLLVGIFDEGVVGN